MLGAYVVQRGPGEQIAQKACVMLEDVVEKSAAYGNLCAEQVLKYVRGLGSLGALRFRFDCGNHFHSYEKLARFAVENSKQSTASELSHPILWRGMGRVPATV